MKPITEMSPIELAAYVQSHLREDGIHVVLSGGATVSYYSNGRYVSRDLDLVNVNFVKRNKIKIAMERLGFQEKGRYYEHPDTGYFVEFPPGPLSVGGEPVKEICEIELPTGTLRIISSTDCVKDRLCAYFFWGDNQGLAQAVMVARDLSVDIDEIKRWANAEDKRDEFEVFARKLE